MKTKTTKQPVRHVPQRTCLACRQVKEKRALVRLVRTAGGNIETDASGKKDGRGAYLCLAKECWEAGLKGGRLEHALHITLTENNRQELARCGEELLKEQPSGGDKQAG